MHPAEFRIDAVVVNRQAGTWANNHVRLAMLEGGSHLGGAERAYIPFGEAFFRSEGSGDFLFVVATEDMLHQEVLPLKRLHSGLLDFLANGLHVVFVLFAKDIVLRQVPLHS